jgi:hypothetical protein
MVEQQDVRWGFGADAYAVERLANGLVRIRCRHSGLAGCYTPDGTYQFGDLRIPAATARELATPRGWGSL